MITALNGRLPSALRTVADTGPNGPQTLRTDAAASWRRMLAAGMPAGCLRSGYRTLAQQSEQDPRLALPAGQSQHGEGVAADTDEPARSWIAAHGAPYGWRIGFVPGEPWHAEYDPATDTPPGPPGRTAQIPQEDDMAQIVKHPNGTLALLGPGPSMRVLHTMTEVDALHATGQAVGERIDLPDPLIWETCKAIARRAGAYSD